MASKKKNKPKFRLSYQWQLFIPLVATLWLIIFGMTYWQFSTERAYRTASINENLNLINKRFIAATQDDSDELHFLDFAVKYYRENPLYDLLRVTVYENGKIKRVWGEPLPFSGEENDTNLNVFNDDENTLEKSDYDNQYYFSKRDVTPDGKIVICTALPFDNDILKASQPSMNIFYIMLVIAIVMTVLAFYSTRYFGRNITILRNVAERAATDPSFIPPMEYPHDELGDITRQIIHMYNERLQALQRQKREHAVAMHAIEEKARNKRQLTNNINHELRTPIGVIKGYLDTILENEDMDEGARTRFLQKARQHVDRLVNLIADVSAITRLEEGADMVATEEINYHDVVYTLASDLEESGTMGKMTFNFEIPLDCIVNGNYNLLSGMILNLCRNSVAYSKGTRCELICTGQDDDFYYFDFRDDGVGVAPEHLPHLFERFYRVDAGRMRNKAGGTGLGLPIVQNTIIAHGGTITVEIGDLGGLSFKFSLPKFNGRRPA